MVASFQDKTFLVNHMASIFAFYHPKCIDNAGGFFHIYTDDGQAIEKHRRHLVNSTRFVINYARMSKITGDQSLLQYCHHGIEFIEEKHRHEPPAYYWELDGEKATTTQDFAYGWAFIMLMYAECIQQGCNGLEEQLESSFEQMSNKFWESEHQLYSDEADQQGNISDYRGQNTNMHACEALLSAYRATQSQQYLDRAYQIAKRITVELASPKENLIWEHYTIDWTIDWDYNKDKPNDMFKPWGFQTGHQTEWAKLLLMLYQYRPEQWMVERAEHLFNSAIEHGWDHSSGGLVYGFSPDGAFCDTDKHFWVQAESFAAAAYLAQTTQNPDYWDIYNKIWDYSWQHLVDHQHGAWYHKVNQQGQRLSNIKSPLGKCDYHTLGACYDVLNALAIK